MSPCWATPGVANSLAGRIVSMLGETPDGRIWVGTRQGDLVLIAPGSGETRWIERSSHPAADDSAVLSMAVLGSNEVWLGRETGIDLRGADDGQLIKRLRRDLHKPWSIAWPQRGGTVARPCRQPVDGQLWRRPAALRPPPRPVGAPR